MDKNEIEERFIEDTVRIIKTHIIVLTEFVEDFDNKI